MIDYIRIESARRFHVIYIDIAGGIFATVCGRLATSLDVRARSFVPATVCQCCRRRLAKPHMIPDWLKNTKEALEHARTTA